MKNMLAIIMCLLVVGLTSPGSAQVTAPGPLQPVQDLIGEVLRGLPPGPPSLQLGSSLHTGLIAGDEFTCHVSNVGNAPMVVAPKLFDEQGTEANNSGTTCDGPLDPGASCYAFTFFNQPFVSKNLRCSVTFVGSKEDIRAVLSSGGSFFVLDPDGILIGKVFGGSVSTTEAR